MTDSVFIIFADVPPFPNEKQLKLYKKCGFNTYLFTEDHLSYDNDKKLYKEKIGLLDRFGLKVWIRGYNDNKKVPDYFEKFSDLDFHDFKNVTGFYFVDEPIVENLNGFEEICVPFFNNKYGDLFWHINLLPSYTNDGSLRLPDIKDKTPIEYYIDRYSAIIKKVNGKKDIGIDHYPLFTKNGKDYISDTWLFDMLTVSSAAKKTGAKISNCVQAFSDIGWRNFSTVKEMKFLMNVQLAFGTTIFEFFLYNRIKGNTDWQPLVDNDKPTFVYEISKQSIDYVSKYAKYFKDLSWQGINCINGNQKEESLNFLHITDGLISQTDIPWSNTNPSFNLIKDKSMGLDGISITSNYDALAGIFTTSDNSTSYFITPYTEPKKNYINNITVDSARKEIIEVIVNGRKKPIFNKHNLTLKLKSGESALIKTR